jgi:cation diffusion facilitator CzcD-associated flavoprotein CzcO
VTTTSSDTREMTTAPTVSGAYPTANGGSLPAPQDLDVVVIGAGFSGLYSIYKFRSLNFSVKVFETAKDLGGTWYWNRYPGCQCDVEARDYQFSFSDELVQEYQWTKRFPEQPDILAYANLVADKFKLRDAIQFETKVTSAIYHEATNRWHVFTDRGDHVTCKVLVSAVGAISSAAQNRLSLPGQDTFKGKVYYTAEWPHEKVSFKGQKVAVVGNGSSGVGVAPEIAKEAEHLTVFQRSAAFTVLARNDTPLDPKTVAAQKAEFKERREKSKMTGFGIAFEDPVCKAAEHSKEQRRELYQKWWEYGGVDIVCSTYSDIVLDDNANETAGDFVREKIREIVNDPLTAGQLCPPAGQQIGTRRICVDNGYYEMFNRENVKLCVVKENPLTKFTETGIELKDGTAIELDSIVMATGFDAVTGALQKIDIRGRNGLSLKEAWGKGARTYIGLGVPGFPNLFTITGPGSPAVHSNMMVSIEQHVEWIADALVNMRTKGIQSMEAQDKAADEWMGFTQMIATFTLFGKTKSWYNADNVEGKPRQFLCHVCGVGAYRTKCDEVAAANYEGFTAVPASSKAHGF